MPGTATSSAERGLKKYLSLLWMFSVLVMSGCMFLPGESFYSGGYAWVGDDLYLYAPMCEGEKLESIQVYTEEENPADYDSPFITDYWNVEGPVDEMTLNGWIVLCDDSVFDRVLVGSGDSRGWPERVFITLWQVDDVDEFTSDLVFRPNPDIPKYSADSDPVTIDYYFDDPRANAGSGVYSPEEIRARMGCAKQHF